MHYLSEGECPQRGSQGASFWKERDKYRTQIKDIREWSDLVLGPNDMMDIYGF